MLVAAWALGKSLKLTLCHTPTLRPATTEKARVLLEFWKEQSAVCLEISQQYDPKRNRD